MKYLLHIGILLGLCSCVSNTSKEVSSEKVAEETTSEISELIIDSVYNNQNIDSLWLRADFDSSVAVIVDGSHDIMNDVSKMDRKHAPSSRRRLNATQLKLVLENLSGKVPSVYRPAECFQPYHGLYFYKNGKINARLAMCFSCGTYFSKPENSGGISYKITKQLFQDLGLPVFDWNDSTEVLNSKMKYGEFFK